MIATVRPGAALPELAARPRSLCDLGSLSETRRVVLAHVRKVHAACFTNRQMAERGHEPYRPDSEPQGCGTEGIEDGANPQGRQQARELPRQGVDALVASAQIAACELGDQR